MTCEPRAIAGGAGATSGVVPWVITSGLYTVSWPSGDKMVASMNTPSVSPFSQVQPSPSTHGVARPVALSGWAGTDTVQFAESAASAAVWLKLNGSPAASTAFAPAAPGRPAGLIGGMPATAAAVAAAEPEADGQGAGAAEPADAGALPLAPGAGALALAAGAVALALAAVAGALALAAAEAQEPRADCSKS